MRHVCLPGLTLPDDKKRQGRNQEAEIIVESGAVDRREDAWKKLNSEWRKNVKQESLD